MHFFFNQVIFFSFSLGKIKLFIPCGFHSAQHLISFLCYTKCVEALAAVALCVSRKSSGKSRVPLASLNKVCLWIPGKKKEGSRDRQLRESMTCLCPHSGKRLCCYLIYAAYCLSSLLITMPAGSPLVLGSPLYFPVVFWLLSFLFCCGC